MSVKEQNRICVIDPNNTIEYTYGLLTELAKANYVTYFTKKTCKTNMPMVHVRKVFYGDNIKSKVYMGLNYLFSYIKIINYVKKNGIDVVHIQWFKMEKIDRIFVRWLKKYTKVVYTAHNVLPHINGESKRKQYYNLYKEVDSIVVHGKAIKEELLNEFDIENDKVYIQPYGYSQLEPFEKSEKSKFVEKIREMKKYYDKVILCVGLINRYKGTDRILKIWNENLYKSNYLLVIAGKINEHFEELDYQLSNMASNIAVEDRHLSDYEFSELCSLADLIVLPYRNASMSGVVYAAARSKTAIMTTNSGTIPDYLEDSVDSIIVSNNEEDLKRTLISSLNKDKAFFVRMGNNLHLNFQKKYQWSVIAKDLVKGCYQR